MIKEKHERYHFFHSYRHSHGNLKYCGHIKPDTPMDVMNYRDVMRHTVPGLEDTEGSAYVTLFDIPPEWEGDGERNEGYIPEWDDYPYLELKGHGIVKLPWRIDNFVAIDLFAAGKPVYGRDPHVEGAEYKLLEGTSYEAAVQNFFQQNPDSYEFRVYSDKKTFDEYVWTADYKPDPFEENIGKG